MIAENVRVASVVKGVGMDVPCSVPQPVIPIAAACSVSILGAWACVEADALGLVAHTAQ